MINLNKKNDMEKKDAMEEINAIFGNNSLKNRELSIEDANYLYHHGMQDIVLKYYDESELDTDYITDEEYLRIYNYCEDEKCPINKIATFAVHINNKRLTKSPIYKDLDKDNYDDYERQYLNISIAREDYVKKHNCKLYMVCIVDRYPWETIYSVVEIELPINIAKYEITGIFLNKNNAEYIANKLYASNMKK